MTARQARPLLGIILLSLAPLLTSGCEKVGNAMGLTGAVGAVAPQPIGPERLRVSLPAKGAQAVLGPVSKTGDTIVWQTLDGITIAFRDGVLVGTRGLGDDLMTADVAGIRALLDEGGANGYQPHIRSFIDGENQTVFRSYQCRRTAQTREQTGLRRIDIRCASPKDSFANIYWLDGAGRVARSRQWVSPLTGYMETERVAR